MFFFPSIGELPTKCIVCSTDLRAKYGFEKAFLWRFFSNSFRMAKKGPTRYLCPQHTPNCHRPATNKCWCRFSAERAGPRRVSDLQTNVECFVYFELFYLHFWYMNVSRRVFFFGGGLFLSTICLHFFCPFEMDGQMVLRWKTSVLFFSPLSTDWHASEREWEAFWPLSAPPSNI